MKHTRGQDVNWADIWLKARRGLAKGWDVLGLQASQHLLLVLTGIVSAAIAYYASSTSEYRNMKTTTLLRALQGEKLYEEGGTYTYLDGIHTFAHDPHVYPFNWKTLKIVRRNVLVPVKAYGSARSVELVDKLYSLVEVATLLTFGSISFDSGIDSAAEVRKCFEPSGFLDRIIGSKFENAPCFKSDEQNRGYPQPFPGVMMSHAAA